jgi:hypothetical protein
MSVTTITQPSNNGGEETTPTSAASTPGRRSPVLEESPLAPSQFSRTPAPLQMNVHSSSGSEDMEVDVDSVTYNDGHAPQRKFAKNFSRLRISTSKPPTMGYRKPTEAAEPDAKRTKYSVAQYAEKKRVNETLVNVVNTNVLAKMGEWKHAKLADTGDFDEHFTKFSGFLDQFAGHTEKQKVAAWLNSLEVKLASRAKAVFDPADEQSSTLESIVNYTNSLLNKHQAETGDSNYWLHKVMSLKMTHKMSPSEFASIVAETRNSYFNSPAFTKLDLENPSQKVECDHVKRMLENVLFTGSTELMSKKLSEYNTQLETKTKTPVIPANRFADLVLFIDKSIQPLWVSPGGSSTPSRSSLKKKQCWNGKECKTSNCKFYHPDGKESDSEQARKGKPGNPNKPLKTCKEHPNGFHSDAECFVQHPELRTKNKK